MAKKSWHAEEAGKPRDKAGVGHSIAGPGVSAVDRGDLQLKSDTQFAQEITRDLSRALSAKEFDRLVPVSGPQILGLLRANFDGHLRPAIVGEIDKDLTAQPIAALEAHLGEIIVV